jgi:hypothetical protein
LVSSFRTNSERFLDCARNDKIDNQVLRRSSVDALRKATRASTGTAEKGLAGRAVPAAEQAELKEIVNSTYGDIVVGKPTASPD